MNDRIIDLVTLIEHDLNLPEVTSEVACIELTTLTFSMLAAARTMWKEEDASEDLQEMCRDLAMHFRWLARSGAQTKEEIMNGFIALVQDLETELEHHEARSVIMMLGVAFDRQEPYSSAEWCAIVICAARKLGYKFDF